MLTQVNPNLGPKTRFNTFHVEINPLQKSNLRSEQDLQTGENGRNLGGDGGQGQAAMAVSGAPSLRVPCERRRETMRAPTKLHRFHRMDPTLFPCA